MATDTPIRGRNRKARTTRHRRRNNGNAGRSLQDRNNPAGLIPVAFVPAWMAPIIQRIGKTLR